MIILQFDESTIDDSKAGGQKMFGEVKDKAGNSSKVVINILYETYYSEEEISDYSKELDLMNAIKSITGQTHEYYFYTHGTDASNRWGLGIYNQEGS
ncbi:MAG: hypothetical protein QM793_00780 [Muricomes sp.]